MFHLRLQKVTTGWALAYLALLSVGCERTRVSESPAATQSQSASNSEVDSDAQGERPSVESPTQPRAANVTAAEPAGAADAVKAPGLSSADATTAAASPATPWHGYIADVQCAGCHPEIADRYAAHPMGRSVSQVPPADAWDLSAARGNPVRAHGFEYEVRSTTEGIVHVQRRLDADGQLLMEEAFQPQVLVGSGHHGQSFLIARDRYLFMSPITWYPEQQVWDLSPGYERRDSEFQRPVVAECLFCHSNRVEPVPSTLNQVVDVAAATEAIGCQRCHGPGADHVAWHQSPGGRSTTDPIVNPGRLEPKLREAVCQQCHLSGMVRLVGAGKHWHDYRPGEPLEHFMLAYAKTAQRGTDAATEQATRFVGHVEQMLSSQCYLESDGKLGCISCHDPHGTPAAAEAAAFYRERCLRCHQVGDCGVDPQERQAQAGDNCAQCHMPRQANPVRHTALTDHRVLRRPAVGAETLAANDVGDGSAAAKPASQSDAEADADSAAEKPSGGSVGGTGTQAVRPTSTLYPVLLGADQRSPEAQGRDLAVALVMAAGQEEGLVPAEELQRALRGLEASLRAQPSDTVGWEAAGQIWLELGNPRQALAAFRQAVNTPGATETSWVWAARVLGAQGDVPRAVGAWKNAQRLNPWMSSYSYELALLLARDERWAECRGTVADAVQRFPTSMGARQLWIESQLQTGDAAGAAESFTWMRRFNPPGMEKVERWYREHPLAQ